jgi:hypothetical protein
LPVEYVVLLVLFLPHHPFTTTTSPCGVKKIENSLRWSDYETHLFVLSSVIQSIEVCFSTRKTSILFNSTSPTRRSKTERARILHQKAANSNHALPHHHHNSHQPPSPHHRFPPSPRLPALFHRHRTSLVRGRDRRKSQNPLYINIIETDIPLKASIHAAHNPRSASPAWPLALTTRSTSPFASSAFSSSESEDTDDDSFAESYDAVTQQGVIGRRSSVESLVLSARIRDFATRLLRSKGESGMIAEKKRSLVGDEDEDAAPVLRPGKVRYSFTS